MFFTGLYHNKICGEERPKYAVYTSQQYLTARFYSDYSRQDDGFKFYFTAFRPGILMLDQVIYYNTPRNKVWGV